MALTSWMPEKAISLGEMQTQGPGEGGEWLRSFKRRSIGRVLTIFLVEGVYVVDLVVL